MSNETKTAPQCQAKDCRTPKERVFALFKRADGAAVCADCNARAMDQARDADHKQIAAATAAAAKPPAKA